MSKRFVIGVDWGGTKIEAVVVGLPWSRPDRWEPSFDVVLQKRIPTRSDLGYEAVLEKTADFVRSIAREADVDLTSTPIGIGMPGSVRRRDGAVKNSNTVCLNGRPFRQDLERMLGRPIAFENDANCFALAEAHLGSARPYRDGVVFGVILGTGVGGGIVLRGSIWTGAQGIAGEWGHHAVVSHGGRACYCGHTGCLEQYASGPAVESDYEQRTGKRLGLREIAARRESDADAGLAIESLVDALGRGLANVIDILDPTAIVLGGGVSNLELLYSEARDRVARHAFNDELTTPILKPALGDSAGVFGAALLAAPP